MHLELAWGTDPGLHRDENEDSILVWRNRGGVDALIVVCDDLALINVGDSPAYLVRDREVRLISQDHSWPAEQVRLGVIKPEEAVDHPMKHRLTRAIGVWEHITVYTDKLTLKPGDQIILCS